MSNSQILKSYLQQFFFLDDEDIQLFMNITHVSSHDAGELLIKEGKVHDKVHFVLEGLVRAYQTKPTGEERTLWIGEPGVHLVDPNSLLNQTASEGNVEVIESSVVATFNILEMDLLELERPNILRFKAWSLQRFVMELFERIQFLSILNTSERFLWLTENHPDLFDRVQQKHIASYIGVSEVHMSRLKKQLS